MDLDETTRVDLTMGAIRVVFADGIARLAGGGAPRHVTLRLIVGVLTAYILIRPLLAAAHELTVAGVASILRIGVATNWWEPVIRRLGLDPIYAGAAIRAAGGVQVAGFAVAGPIGTTLHSALPHIFLACDQVAPGAGVSMVARPGAPTLGGGLASFGANVVWLTIGLWVFWWFRRRNRPIALVGLLIQGQIAVNHLLQGRLALADLDASGIPFALRVVIPSAGWITDDLASLSNVEQQLALGVSVLVLGYASAFLLLSCGSAANRVRLGRRRVGPTNRAAWSGAMKRSTASVGATVAFATAWSPIGACAMGSSNWHEMTAASNPRPQTIPRTSAGHRRALRLTGATIVNVVHQQDGSWKYVVDGTAETTRSVGYNPSYASLSPAQRRSLYDVISHTCSDWGSIRSRAGLKNSSTPPRSTPRRATASVS